MTEGEKKNPMWTDTSGEYYSWLKELWAWQVELEAKNRFESQNIHRSASELPKPRLTFLVGCLVAIRQTPELWEKITNLARKYPKPELLPEDESNDLAGLVGLFLAYYEMKHGQEETLNFAQSTLFGILYDQERAHIEASDADLIRQNVLSAFFTDDIQ
jgi:hypothetical protein